MSWGWHSAWHWLAMAGAWVAVLGLAVSAAMRLFPSGARPDPRDLLDERLARGEIDVAQYRLLRDEREQR